MVFFDLREAKIASSLQSRLSVASSSALTDSVGWRLKFDMVELMGAFRRANLVI